jgi:glycolate oxidase iron-sulfur subunit
VSGTGYAALDACVHCGFCLQSCPTYLVTGDESDSPRGRIVLMQALARGAIAPDDPALRTHLDRCLGCRGCEPVCPSGVGYGSALEAARRDLAAARPIPLVARLVLTVFAEPVLRVPALWLARIARALAPLFSGGSRLGFAWGMLGATRPVRGLAAGRVAETRGAPAPPDGPAAIIFQGCVMAGLFGHVHAATARVLAANGCRTVAVTGQGCCGALHLHAGAHDEALALARANVAAFAAQPGAAIVVNSAGCGATLKAYGELLADDPLAPAARAMSARVQDVTETLAARGPRRGAPLDASVAYDPPCHLLHAQRVSAPVEAVLNAIPGIRRVAHAEAALCCGSAGIYSLVEPALSREVLARKVVALFDADPDIVVTGNPGCIMQVGAGLRAVGSDTPVVHPVELLDASYERAGFYDRVSPVRK